MARSDPQVNIRMPADLKERLEGVLSETNRSLNAEIIARLNSSFDSGSDHFSTRMRTLIERYCEAHDLDFETAVSNILTAGLNPDAPLVISLQLGDKTDVETIVKALDAIQDRVPKKTRINVDMPPGRQTGKSKPTK